MYNCTFTAYLQEIVQLLFTNGLAMYILATIYLFTYNI